MPESLGTGYPPWAGVSLWQLLALFLLATFLNFVINHPQMLLNLPLMLLNLPFLQRSPTVPPFSQSMKFPTYNTTNLTKPL